MASQVVHRSPIARVSLFCCCHITPLIPAHFVCHPCVCTQHRASIELGDVTSHNIKQLKTLNQVVFPVSYNERFYIDVLEAGDMAKLAYYNDIVVGAVCCRLDTSENQRRLYIMTLGCLLPYRRLGIGSVMVNHILSFAEADGNFDSIFL